MLSLVWRGVGRGITHVVTQDKRIELDHRAVVVEHRYRGFSRYLARERGDVAYPGRHDSSCESTNARRAGQRWMKEAK